MNSRRQLATLIKSWDIWMAILSTMVVAINFYYYHYDLTFEQAKEILGATTTVLSIIFSVFFAGLAILIAAGDNEFVYFLTESGVYSDILWTFRVTLISLFVALGLSIVLYVLALSYDSKIHSPSYPKSIMTGFTFFAVYALFAAANSSLDAIKYAEYRAKYIEATHIDSV